MMNRVVPVGVLLFVVSSMSLVGDSRALTIIVEPDRYSDGADISNAYFGVALSVEGSNAGGGSVTATVTSQTSTGLHGFGNEWVSLNAGGRVWREAYATFRADFEFSVSFVSIDLVGDNGSDFGFLEAYSSGGFLIERVDSDQLTTGLIETLGITSIGTDIAYVLASGSGGDALILDNLIVSQIPEPSTALLLCAGLIHLTQRQRGRGRALDARASWRSSTPI